MNVFNYSLPSRKVALVVSTAILSMTAQAEIKIGRLPSIHAGDGQVVGAKPNLFLLIANNESMSAKGFGNPSPEGNNLQKTAAALITSLPQLEGKVRLGYTTVFPGYDDLVDKYKLHCKDFKLNGNVQKIDRFIPGILQDLKGNPNYVTGERDFVFKDKGSGYGEIAPRNFEGNYARYIYAWLGGMCPGRKGGHLSTGFYPRDPVNDIPPYGDLSKPTEYETSAAKHTLNPLSYNLTNFQSQGKNNKGTNPAMQKLAAIIGVISDRSFLETIIRGQDCKTVTCGETNMVQENKSGRPLRGVFPFGMSEPLFSYDAYSPERADNGFPSTEPPLSCRKNYMIVISDSPFGVTETLSSNTNQAGSFGVRKDRNGIFTFQMPNGQMFPKDSPYTRPYKFFPKAGEGNVVQLGSGKNYTGAADKFSLARLILQTYYSDLRSDLPNDVAPFYAFNGRKEGANGAVIPKFWDRKNDPANWQHLTTFFLGFGDGFDSWNRAQIYKKNFPNTKPEDGLLEPYFRAIESDVIYDVNKPLADWGRGGYGLASLKGTNKYFYKDPQTGVVDPIDIYVSKYSYPHYLSAIDAFREMDFAKAGVVGRGGTYDVRNYDAIKNVISAIAERIETAMAQGISGGAISGGSRVTASQQAAGGNDSILFTTYLDQASISGNIFAFKNCPLIQEMSIDESGDLVRNPLWDENNCGKRLWNAATALYESADISDKTIVPVGSSGSLSGATFAWDNLDQELKTAFETGGNEALGKARVEWLNGKLQSQLDSTVASKLRQRSTISIPDEKQHYKRKPDGTLEKDSEGNIILADPTSIPNLMGEIVYALPKAVDNRGTLPAAHPLNNQSYNDFVNNVVKNRKTLVLAGSNDGRLYGFNTADDGENASLAFSFIPRDVILKNNTNIIDFTKPDAVSKASSSDGLVNGPFAVRDAQVNGKWGTYVVGTLGEGGDAIYALDISDGRANPNMFKWEVSGRGYGNIMAEPRIVWLRAPESNIKSDQPKGKWVVLLPTGYNADISALIVLDLENGAELAKIDTAAKYTAASSGSTNNTLCKLAPSKGNNQTLWNKLSEIGDVYLPKSLTCDNGLGALTVFDADSDSGADFVFAGDLMGHIWKFDLTGFFDTTGNQVSDLNNALKVAYDSPLFIAQTPVKSSEESTRQPITTMITIDDGAYGEGSMLYFGTGRMFNQIERGLTQVESFYSIWDIPRYSEQTNITGFSLPLRRNPILAAPGSQYDFIRYETFVIPASAVNDPKSSLKNFKEIRGVKRIDKLDSSNYLSYDLQGKSTSSDDKAVGWIIDFPSDDALERVINRSYSFEDTIFFPTFSPKGGSAEESCSPIRSGVGGDARFYMVDRFTGGQLERSPFDFNHDGTQNDPAGKDGVKVDPKELGKNGDLSKLGYNGTPDEKDGTIPVSPAGILIGAGGGDFLSVTGVLEREKQATNKYNCDYSRQVVFPSTVDPVTGNPLVLSSCNRNRYRVWKQPVIE